MKTYIDHERLFDSLEPQECISQFWLYGNEDDFFLVNEEVGVRDLRTSLQIYLKDQNINPDRIHIYERVGHRFFQRQGKVSERAVAFPGARPAGTRSLAVPGGGASSGQNPPAPADPDPANDTRSRTADPAADTNLLRKLIKELNANQSENQAVIFCYPDSLVLENDQEAFREHYEAIAEISRIKNCRSYLILKKDRIDDFRFVIFKNTMAKQNTVREIDLPCPSAEIFRILIRRIIQKNRKINIEILSDSDAQTGIETLALKALSRGNNLKQFCYSIAQFVKKQSKRPFVFLENIYGEDDIVQKRINDAKDKLFTEFIGCEKDVKEPLASLITSLTNVSNGLPHTLILGPNGSGKSLLAKLLAELYLCLGRKSGKVVRITYGNIISGINSGEVNGNMLRKIEEARDGVILLDDVQRFMGENEWARQALRSLIEEIEQKNYDLPLILTIPDSEEYKLQIRRFPGLHALISKTIVLKNYRTDDLWRILQRKIAQRNIKYSEQMKEKVIRYFNWLIERGFIENGHAVDSMFSDLYEKCQARIANGHPAFIYAKDVPEPAEFDKEAVDSILARMDSQLTGLRRVKMYFRQLAEQQEDISKSSKGTSQEALKANKLNNFVFLGNPGTGKTTVAEKYVCALFNRMGLVSSEKIRIVDPISHFSSQGGENYSQRVRNVFEEAKHGVLFIDEAYQLSTGSNGKEILDQIVKIVTEPEFSDIVVIMAGYYEDMQAIYKLNPGFKRRFRHEVFFDDFSIDELVAIFENERKKTSLKILGDDHKIYDDIEDTHVTFFRSTLKNKIQQMSQKRHFGNAGEIKNYFSVVRGNFHHRIRKSSKDIKTQDFCFLKTEDLDVEVDELKEDIQSVLADLSKNMIKVSELQNTLTLMHQMQQYEIKRAAVLKLASMPSAASGFNMFLVGEKGSGRSTACQYIARAYYSLGLVLQKKPRITSALQLTGRYVGQTKDTVIEFFEKSAGNLIVLRDFEQLLDQGERGGDFAREAISTFFNEIADPKNQSTPCIILCNNETVAHFKQEYPVVDALFPRTVYFEQLTTGDCVELVIRKLSEANYSWKCGDSVIRKKLKEIFMRYTMDNDTVNGAFVNKTVGQIVSRAGKRLTDKGLENIDDPDQFMELIEQDFSI